MPAYTFSDPWSAAQTALLHSMLGTTPTPAPPVTPPASTPPGTTYNFESTPGANSGATGVPAFGSTTLGATDNQGGTVYGTGTPGPDDAAATAAGFLPGSVPNNGQKDLFGNTYWKVDNSLWNGQYIDPLGGMLPPKSTGINSQLWGGPTSDGPPRWLQQIVQDAMAMPDGAAKTARIQHIMSSIIDPKSGANQHDLGFVERSFGIK